MRRATPADRDLVRALRLRGLREDPRSFGARLDEEEHEPDAFWDARLADANARTFLAENAGLCTLLLHDEPAEIVGMWVAPEARERGLAGALLRAALDEARAVGRARVALWVNVEMTAAVRAYERAGFRADGPPRAGTKDPTRTYQRMMRSLL